MCLKVQTRWTSTLLFFSFAHFTNADSLGVSNLLLEIIWVINSLACKRGARRNGKGKLGNRPAESGLNRMGKG